MLPSSQPSSSGPGLYYTYTYFTPDDSEIYSYSVFGNTINVREYILTTRTNTHPEPEVEHKLDYLALGGSYTSGEGICGKGAYILSSWYKRRKGLPLGSRSYPFLLRDYYGIDNDKMASVACSGAVVMPGLYW